MAVCLLCHAGCPQTSSSGEGWPIPISKRLLALVLCVSPVPCAWPEPPQHEPGTDLRSPSSAVLSLITGTVHYEAPGSHMPLCSPFSTASHLLSKNKFTIPRAKVSTSWGFSGHRSSVATWDCLECAALAAVFDIFALLHQP